MLHSSFPYLKTPLFFTTICWKIYFETKDSRTPPSSYIAINPLVSPFSYEGVFDKIVKKTN